METSRIAELLGPFLALASDQETGTGRDQLVLNQAQLEHISIYIDILSKWNARINLTAIRQPEEIVTRHFGESLFAATSLFPAGQKEPGAQSDQKITWVVDVGSGAGFPGLPIKIWASTVRLTLIESNHRKATFLREVCRSLALADVDVFAGRAERFLEGQADLVTLRAVEQFNSALPMSARLVAGGGRLALLVVRSQVSIARELEPQLLWDDPIPVPQSSSRVLLVARRNILIHEPS